MFVVRSVRTKILALSICAVLLTAAALVTVVLIEKTGLSKSVNEELNVLAKNETAKIAKDVYLMCQAQNEAVQQNINCNLRVARDVMAQEGEVLFGKKNLRWNAVNQSTKAAIEVELPEMFVGKTSLGQNADMSVPSSIVDKVKELVGGTCTVFQRMNQAGDILRVCTNVESLDGKRAVGTYIPAINPDGTMNPVVSTVMRGETYRGRAYVVNAWYITAYEPIFGEKHEIVGVLYVGVKEENVESLRKGIMNIVVGKTGYVFVLGGKDDQKGRYIISAAGKRDGEDIWEAKDADGNLFIQSVVQKALLTKEGAVDFERYPWKNVGENVARMKLTAITYFEPWDWVIGAGAYEDDFMDAKARVATALNAMVLLTVIAAVILVAIFIVFSFILSGRIANPLRKAAVFAQRVAEGDLTQNIQVRQKDEVGQLASALNHMSENLRDVMSRIQSASGQVASSSEELSASAQNLSSATTEQASSLEETSAAIEELASSVEQNAENSKSANEIARTAARDAEKGGNAVLETVEAMRKIANQIAIVDDIADQTNLLALNAAIEAARAGEMGKGFAVVAVEVRKLAERSQQAAKEISELAGNSVERAEKAGQLIQQIVPDIRKTAELVEEITTSCQEQSSGANQIRNAVSSLDQVTQQNSATSEETAAASEELSGQAQVMQEMISRFQIGTNGAALAHDGQSIAGAHELIQTRTDSPPPRLPAPKSRLSQEKEVQPVEFREF
ncbi:MAG: Cache 3/Cache 2 fusion domain-containing protein [bacterium]